MYLDLLQHCFFKSSKLKLIVQPISSLEFIGFNGDIGEKVNTSVCEADMCRFDSYISPLKAAELKLTAFFMLTFLN